MPRVETYSHRDRRAHRDIDRAAVGMLVAVVGLSALALVAGDADLSLAAIAALAALGGAYALWGNSLLALYRDDLRVAADPEGPAAFARAEVGSSVGLTTPHRAPPSPHHRRVGRRPDSRRPDR